MPSIVAYLLATDGPIPNHPRWPLLVYPSAVPIAGPDPALAFEGLFTHNRWPAAWRCVVLPAGTGHKKIASVARSVRSTGRAARSSSTGAE